jgi:sugar lactone lactonase YvrE
MACRPSHSMGETSADTAPGRTTSIFIHSVTRPGVLLRMNWRDTTCRARGQFDFNRTRTCQHLWSSGSNATATDRGRRRRGGVLLVIAIRRLSRVHRYDPDGRLMAQYHLPARNPTMPAFGGPDMKTLFVTTARDKNGGPGGRPLRASR